MEKDMTIFNLALTVTNTEEAAVNFCRLKHLIPDEKVCIKCNRGMKKYTNKKLTAGFTFACRNCPENGGKTRKESPLVGSYFEQCNLAVSTILKTIFMWSKGVPVKLIISECDISSGTAADHGSYLREMCLSFCDNLPAIGGPGKVVEIDKSVFARKRSNRGRLVPELWIFGGVERSADDGPQKCFLEVIYDRRRRTLWPIIMQRIAPGTRIISDGSSAYVGLDRLPGYSYSHDVVNRTIHTNTIKGLWGLIKHKYLPATGRKRKELRSRLAEFVFRRNFKGSVFNATISHIALLYPGSKRLADDKKLERERRIAEIAQELNTALQFLINNGIIPVETDVDEATENEAESGRQTDPEGDSDNDSEFSP